MISRGVVKFRKMHSTAALLVLIFSVCANGVIIYDSVGPDATFSSNILISQFAYQAGERIGDYIFASGDARQITKIEIYIQSYTSFEQEHVMHFDFAEYSGSPASPGAYITSRMVAQQTPLADLSSGYPDPVDYILEYDLSDNPVTVPDEFLLSFWTSSPRDLIFGYKTIDKSSAPYIGSSTAGVEMGNPFTANQELFSRFGVDNLAIRIHAVPEPATIILSLAAGIMLRRVSK